MARPPLIVSWPMVKSDPNVVSFAEAIVSESSRIILSVDPRTILPVPAVKSRSPFPVKLLPIRISALLTLMERSLATNTSPLNFTQVTELIFEFREMLGLCIFK